MLFRSITLCFAVLLSLSQSHALFRSLTLAQSHAAFWQSLSLQFSVSLMLSRKLTLSSSLILLFSSLTRLSYTLALSRASHHRSTRVNDVCFPMLFCLLSPQIRREVLKKVSGQREKCKDEKEVRGHRGVKRAQRGSQWTLDREGLVGRR